MAYEMNAEGTNGVQQTTYLINNTGGGGWIFPPPLPDGPLPPQNNGSVLLLISAVQGEPNPDLAALQCLGTGKGPGVIGQSTGGEFGTAGPGVGVAGFNITGMHFEGTSLVPSNTPTFAFNQSLAQTAGVFGLCDGGPGVKGQGGDALNLSTGFPNLGVIAAGLGVFGIGGRGAPASTENDGSIKFPALPPGAGVIGVAGGASPPDPSLAQATGVIGRGSPAANGFDPGRGGVFGSDGNIAQAQLMPAPGGAALPEVGRFGDLYMAIIETELPGKNGAEPMAYLFLCVVAGSPPSTKAQWAPFILGATQSGGNLPLAPPIFT
jgi:hypothetical protein